MTWDAATEPGGSYARWFQPPSHFTAGTEGKHVPAEHLGTRSYTLKGERMVLKSTLRTHGRERQSQLELLWAPAPRELPAASTNDFKNQP